MLELLVRDLILRLFHKGSSACEIMYDCCVVPHNSSTDAKIAVGWVLSALKALGSNPGQVTGYHEYVCTSRSFGWLIFCFQMFCVATYVTQFVFSYMPFQ